ncbi:S10 family peptidase [Butyrivibrio sp. AC2005]|uniref:S10 family peptidase n=1 Tax=Butyrivibrio sp. AC2005 TaxID=1280672 RepID=UPI0018CAF5A8|nr:hypothetical protein [Butyrivibrio sp. AC2005]
MKKMFPTRTIVKRFFGLVLMVSMLTMCVGMNEEPESEETTAEKTTTEKTTTENMEQADPDSVTTRHQVTIEGKKVDYSVTAGMMPVTIDGNACSIFYTAYTMEGVKDTSERPVTFAFNGGPGSSSEWVHLGFLGPRHVELDEEGQPTQFPSKIVDNENSILDITDLVFIDPVGTGYSHVADGVDEAFFSDYRKDIASVGEFIRLYISRNSRWQSPKYLAGESYGTMRAVGLADYLSSNFDMGLNGLLLLSNVNDFSILNEVTQSDISYVLLFPSYASTGYYHKLLDKKYQDMDLEEFLKEAKKFAEEDYQTALFKGARMTDNEKENIAKKYSELTGLDKDYVLKSDLRVFLPDFCMNLLADKGQMVGRLDSRYIAPLSGKDASDFEDPSNSVLGASFGAAVNQYISEELGYHTDRTYYTSSVQVGMDWTFGIDNGTIDLKQTVGKIMSENKYLKVWVLGGYYDLATPFTSAEWIFNHVPLQKETRKNISYTFYPSGHMIYMHQPSLEQFRKDAKEWYGAEE